MAKGHKGPGMGRRNIPINKEEFEKLCGLYCTCLDIAGWFHCSVDTIERFINGKQIHERSLSEFHSEGGGESPTDALQFSNEVL